MQKNFKKIAAITFATIFASLSVVQIANAREGKIKAKGANGKVVAASKNGNSIVKGHGVKTNADGSITTANGQAFKAANGAVGAHAGSTTINPDGSATHLGGLNAKGQKGSVMNQNSAYKNSDGTYGGSSNTAITSNKTGNSYNGTATYDSTTGLTKSATCTNASGAIIACPTRN